MRRHIAALVKKYWYKKAVVLMYHRVAPVEHDAWELAVHPQVFEQHLQVLKKCAHVVSVPQLVAGLRNRSLPKNSVAITFDDGYEDNFKNAAPLLERYGLPATFFIASGNIGTEKNFWWDELEHLLLSAPQLPASFSMTINNTLVEGTIEGEEQLSEPIKKKHKAWKALTEAPPTQRSKLYYSIWEQLKFLPPCEQTAVLQQVKHWASLPDFKVSECKSMSVSQLVEMSRHPLFTIGAHTVLHPALGMQPHNTQEKELADNKAFLEQKIKQGVSLLAYPYGNYNSETIDLATGIGFDAAFATEEKSINKRSHLYQLGRFQVLNWDGAHFEKKLSDWFRNNHC